MGAGSKTRRRAAKAAHRKALEAEFGLQPTPKRGKDKCFVDRIRQQQDADLHHAAIEVRCTQMGLPNTEANMQRVKAPWFECEAGQALYVAHPQNEDEVRRLWGVVTEWRKSEARFLGLIVGRRMWPGKDSVPYIPEPTETRDDFDYDLRDEEERVDAARKGWNAFCANTGLLTERQQRICFRGIWDAQPLFLRRDPGISPRLTFDGRAFVMAIARVADEIERN